MFGTELAVRNSRFSAKMSEEEELLFAMLSDDDFAEAATEKEENKSTIELPSSMKLKRLQEYWFTESSSAIPDTVSYETFKSSSSFMVRKRALIEHCYFERDFERVVSECRFVLEMGANQFGGSFNEQLLDIYVRSLFQLQMYGEAAALLEEMLIGRGVKVPTLLLLVRCREQMKEFDKAFESYKTLLSISRHNPMIWRSAGECLWAMGESSSTLLCFAYALRLIQIEIDGTRHSKLSESIYSQCRMEIIGFVDGHRNEFKSLEDVKLCEYLLSFDWTCVQMFECEQSSYQYLQRYKSLLDTRSNTEDESEDENLVDPFSL